MELIPPQNTIKTSTFVYLGHKNWNMVLNMMIGI
jgi:hypothetical protein